MGLISFMMFLMTGTVGLFSVLQFNKTIFGSIRGIIDANNYISLVDK